MAEVQFINGRVVGSLENGVFYQKINSRHIYRRYGAKGMDKDLYRSLRGKCRIWRLEFEDTGQILEIAFQQIEQFGWTADSKGAGTQIFVRFKDFEEIKPVMQRRMI